ncbi:hypothetical protein CLOM_g6402 [Closterium sp. NIES-68]|nr:hypothetical protein CLOM_g6402 [Closterium sp. NIES-68]GJP68551.1 hypothetical protein CLOP_g25238 [Closterium sp. NIES-67]
MASALRVLRRDAAPKAFLPLAAARLSTSLLATRAVGTQPPSQSHGLDSIFPKSGSDRGAGIRCSGTDCDLERVAPPLPRIDELCDAIGSRFDLARSARSTHGAIIWQTRGLPAWNARQPDSQQNPSTALRHVALLHSSSVAHITSGGGESTGSREGSSGAAGHTDPHTSSAAAGGEGVGSQGHGERSSDTGSSSSSSSSGGEDGDSVKAAVLQAALTHVSALGWSSAALIAGARDRGLSPSVLGMLPRGEAHLVEFFMDRCRKQFEAEFPHTPIAVATAAPGSSSGPGQGHPLSYEAEDSLALQSRMAAAIRTRLNIQAPYTSTWHQALAIQARPSNACHALRQRRQLAASMWSAVGVRCSDAQLLAYRVLLGSAYAAAEVHMLTDFSPDFHDTWRFVDREMQAAFQMKGSADRLVSQACDSIPAIKTVLSILSKPPKPSAGQA